MDNCWCGELFGNNYREILFCFRKIGNGRKVNKMLFLGVYLKVIEFI